MNRREMMGAVAALAAGVGWMFGRKPAPAPPPPEDRASLVYNGVVVSGKRDIYVCRLDDGREITTVGFRDCDCMGRLWPGLGVDLQCVERRWFICGLKPLFIEGLGAVTMAWNLGATMLCISCGEHPVHRRTLCRECYGRPEIRMQTPPGA